ncbi:MAG: Mu transposase C-terminal domain-containing protein, partial [Desulfotomaculaceae bacterium]|nr:Mu transposase C-terminal domain-containing protein [Desulfotomaculaceae bacterium]
SRTIKHDATLSLNNVLYETPPEFAGRKVNVRYDPDMFEDGLSEIFLYSDDKCIGTAKKIHFADNANMKRRGRPSAASKKEPRENAAPDPPGDSLIHTPKNTISFSSMDRKGVTP